MKMKGKDIPVFCRMILFEDLSLGGLDTFPRDIGFEKIYYYNIYSERKKLG